MRELKLFTVIAMLCWHGFAQGQNKTVLSSEIYGYKQDLVYYDCIQSPSVTAEFHNNPGEQYVYPFTTRFSPIVMLINGKTERSEEHTSELQSRQYLVCRLLLEKKQQTNRNLNNRALNPVNTH